MAVGFILGGSACELSFFLLAEADAPHQGCSPPPQLIPFSSQLSPEPRRLGWCFPGRDLIVSLKPSERWGNGKTGEGPGDGGVYLGWGLGGAAVSPTDTAGQGPGGDRTRSGERWLSLRRLRRSVIAGTGAGCHQEPVQRDGAPRWPSYTPPEMQGQPRGRDGHPRGFGAGVQSRERGTLGSC